VTYRVNPNQNITNEYGKENPACPGTRIEPIKEIGREDSRKDHDLNISRRLAILKEKEGVIGEQWRIRTEPPASHPPAPRW